MPLFYVYYRRLFRFQVVMTMQIGKVIRGVALVCVVSGCSTVSKWTPSWVGNLTHPFDKAQTKAVDAPQQESTTAVPTAPVQADQKDTPGWKARFLGMIDGLLYQKSASPSSTPARGAVPSGAQSLIMPDDQVSIRVFNRPQLTTEGRVDNAGEIDMPVLGRVLVAGLTPNQAMEYIARRLVADGVDDPLVDLSVSR